MDSMCDKYEENEGLCKIRDEARVVVMKEAVVELHSAHIELTKL